MSKSQVDSQNTEINKVTLPIENEPETVVRVIDGREHSVEITDDLRRGTETVDVDGHTRTVSIANKNQSNTAVSRFFDRNNGTHFFTSDATEAQNIVATRSDLVSEGPGFVAAGSTDISASPIYRFFDTNNGTHFFTSDQDEKNGLLTARPDLTYEGADFYEHLTQQAGDTAVYRFFDSKTGTHFFTSDNNEKANISTSLPDYKYEGIAFWSPSH